MTGQPGCRWLTGFWFDLAFGNLLKVPDNSRNQTWGGQQSAQRSLL